jgi:hypothetical protein
MEYKLGERIFILCMGRKFWMQMKDEIMGTGTPVLSSEASERINSLQLPSSKPFGNTF